MKGFKRGVAWALALVLSAQTALPVYALQETVEQETAAQETPAETVLPVQPEVLLEAVGGLPELQDSPLLLASVTAGAFTYAAQNETECYITAYSGEEAVLTVPSTLNGYTVTGIGGRAFAGKTALEQVTLPDSVEYLGENAFADCTGLTQINYPKSLSAVDGSSVNSAGHVFAGCTALKSITVPDGVTQIPNYAFQGCTSLETVVLPESLQTIGTRAFFNCTALVTADLPESLTALGEAAFTNCALTRVTVPGGVGILANETFANCTGLESLTLEAGITELKVAVFAGCTAIKNLSLPEGLSRVGEKAFSGCTALEQVTLPDSVSYLDERVFENCTGLTRINYPRSLSVVDGDIVNHMGYLFAGCTALKSITVPDGVTAIPNYAFQGCESLETVILPESLQTIGDRAFFGLGLKHITLPASLTTIGKNAFENSALTQVTVPGGVSVLGQRAFANCTGLESLTLEAGVTELQDEAFAGCTALKTLSLPEGLKTVQAKAFSGCTALEQVTLPDSVSYLGERVFENCTRLTQINYPRSLSQVDGNTVSNMGHVFAGCTALKHIAVPEGVTHIANYALQGCESLESVTLPESLRTIGKRAFYGTGLKSLTLPDGVTTLGEAAFGACTALSGLQFGTGLEEIGTEAFAGCTALGELGMPYGPTVIGKGAFADCTGLRRVTVGEGTETIGERAFANCGGITALTLPEGLKEIGSEAFSGCSALTALKLPDSITTLYGSVFANCTKLTSVNLPASLTKVDGTYAFERGHLFAGCTALTTVVVPAGMTAIPDYTFRGCTTLREILLPESVTSLGNYAFLDCTGLRKVYVPETVATFGDDTFSGCGALTIYGVAGSPAQQYALEKGIPFTTDSPVAPVSGLAGLVLTDGGTPLEGVTVTLYHVETGDVAFTLTTDADGRWSTLQALQGQTYQVYYYCPGYDITPQNEAYTLGEAGQTAQTAIAVKAFDLPEKDSDGFAYTVLNGTYCKITGYTGQDTVVRVPAQMDGYIVQSLADRVFRNQTGLTAVVLPDTVETVGKELFSGCTGLTDVWLSAGLKDTGTGIFRGCTGLKRIALPGGLQTLGSEAFMDCTGLEQVILPEGLVTVGTRAFSGCTGLESITLPDSITSLSARAFENCTALAQANYPKNWAECPSVNSNVEGDVFAGCPLMTTITVPEGVTAIPNYAFKGSSSLTKIILPQGLKTIGKGAFMQLPLTEMHLPASVETVGQEAFSGCTALEAFSAEGVVTLGQKALYGCTALREVILGDSLRTVEKYCFQNCSALVRLDLGEGVEEIGLYAFAGCAALPSVKLPDSLTILASGAFLDCTALKTVNYPVNWAQCPSPNAYNGNQGFVFANTAVTQMVIPEGVTAVPAYAFSNCGNLAAVTLPESLTSIGEFAFYETALEQVHLPAGLKVLGNSAFANCAALKLVRAPFEANDDLDTLGSGVLSNGGEGLTVWCCSASKMHYYAQDAGIAVELLDAHEHTMEETLRQEPGCEADGFSQTRCTICGYEHREVLAKLGHEFETEYTVDVPATCQRAGSRSYHCVRCEAVTGEEELPATGHSLTGWVVTKAPTVLLAGEKTRGCNYCELTETETMPALVLTEDMLESYGLVHFTVVHAQELTPVADAAICVVTPEGDITYFTDSEGKVSCILPVGKLPVMVQAPGCKSRSLKIDVRGGEQELPQIGVSERDPVQVELKHHVMTYEEIIAAGIDPNAEGNSHVYRYELTLTFVPVLDFIGLTYLFSESGELLRFPEITFPGPGGGDDGSSEHRDNTFYLGEPVGREDEYGPYHAAFWHKLWGGEEEAKIVITEKFLLIIYGEVKWLKEMFDVEMIILNASQTDSIEQCEAELMVPGGLSLATMLPDREQQTFRRQVPKIEPGGTHSLHWYLRGDMEGSYDIKATLDGVMMPFAEPFHYEYVAEEPIKVYAGSALRLTLTVDDVVYYGTDAIITIALQNVSDRTLYNVSHTINNTLQKRVTYTTKEGKTTVDEDLIGSSGGTGGIDGDQRYVIPEFHPGDQLVVEGTIEICFNAKALKERFKDLIDEMLSLSNSFNAISEAFDAGGSVIDATSDISDALDSGLISTDTIKASGSLSALTDYAEFSKGNATQTAGRPGFMGMLHDLVDSLPIRYVLESVSVKTMEDSTTEIPWVINTVPGPPVNPLIPAGSISMTKLIYSIAILLIDRQDVKVGGMTLAKDYTNTAEAMEYVTYCWEQTAAIRAADPSGEAHWRTYYVAAESRTRTAGEPVTIEIDNKTAQVDENGVWTFTGPAIIQVTPHSMAGGTLYVQEGNNAPKAYVISVVEPHECAGSAWEVGVPATEHTVGYRYQYCDICGEMCNVENLRSCGDHTFASWLMEVAPVNDYHGVETRTCTKCGVLEYRFVADSPVDSLAGLVTEASGSLTDTGDGLCLVLPQGATAESFFATLTQPQVTQRMDADGTLLEQEPLATGQTLSMPGLSGVLTLVLPGDVNGDGLADIADADRALAFAAGEQGREAALLAADADGDGSVTLADAAALACKAAGVEEAPAKTLLALYGEGGQMLQAVLNPETVPNGAAWQKLNLFLLDGENTPQTPAVCATK